jgi:hypothetical protein
MHYVLSTKSGNVHALLRLHLDAEILHPIAEPQFNNLHAHCSSALARNFLFYPRHSRATLSIFDYFSVQAPNLESMVLSTDFISSYNVTGGRKNRDWISRKLSSG